MVMPKHGRGSTHIKLGYPGFPYVRNSLVSTCLSPLGWHFLTLNEPPACVSPGALEAPWEEGLWEVFLEIVGCVYFLTSQDNEQLSAQTSRVSRNHHMSLENGYPSFQGRPCRAGNGVWLHVPQ